MQLQTKRKYKIYVDLDTANQYKIVMQVVVETEEYISDVKRVGLTEEEKAGIINYIASRPDAGNEIKGTGGARKVRFAAKGKGKSGGVRVITFYSGVKIPVFLLNIFAKNERADLSQSERNIMKQALTSLTENYKGKIYDKGRRKND